MISQRRLVLLFVLVAGVAACAASSKPLPPLEAEDRNEFPPSMASSADAGAITTSPTTDADSTAQTVTGDSGVTDGGRSDAGDSGTSAADAARTDAGRADASVDAN